MSNDRIDAIRSYLRRVTEDLRRWRRELDAAQDSSRASHLGRMGRNKRPPQGGTRKPR